ncbi:hypothetical protein [Photorhabdus tasmaniensis]|uniref:phage tail fiber protein n=1 Tax=Photorhabdus tasmaniensis TaxID=1004159 RepID=UPI00140DD9E9|nr:hypothetical protein [Photorhabdus tasmaniensis]
MSATGGNYPGFFSFKHVETIPVERNAVMLVSSGGGLPSGNLVSYSHYNWYDNDVRTGIIRGIGRDTLGYAVDINRKRVLTVSGSGQIEANGNQVLVFGRNCIADANGFLKKSSPIVEIHSDGTFTTNDESKGATVERLSEGVYLVSGTLGFNADAAWGGIDGGIEIPLCKNKLPLIWVDYEVMQDGAIKLMTYHREHPDAPVFAKNMREGYANGDLIDIPLGRFVSVRVQMPGADDEKLST